jgi:hypothetical protein
MKFRSLIAEDASGSAGLITVSKTAGRSFLRKKSNPTNPNSIAQRNVRADFGANSQSYRLLSDAQRLAWANFGANVTLTDALGQSYNLSGAQAHAQINGVLSAIGAPPVSDPPSASDAPGQLPTITLTATENGALLQLRVVSAAYAGRVMIFATKPVSAGVNYFSKSAFRLIETSDNLAAGSTSISASYVAKFGLPALGQKIGVKLVPVSDTGIRGGNYLAFAIVTGP